MVLPLDRVIVVSLLALFWYVVVAVLWICSLTPAKWLPLAGLLYLLAPLAGSMTFLSVTSSWVPLLSLTSRVAPSCPMLVPVGGALVPGACAAVVLAWLVAGVPCLSACRGGDAEHEATRSTAAVRPTAAPSTPTVRLVRVWWLIGGLRRVVASPLAAVR